MRVGVTPTGSPPRREQVFFELGHFALQEAERRSIAPEFSSTPSRDGCAGRFEEYCRENESRAGIEFLTAAVNDATTQLGIAPDEFVGEMVDATLGDHYPVPDRILSCPNQLVSKYLDQVDYDRSLQSRRGTRFSSIPTQSTLAPWGGDWV